MEWDVKMFVEQLVYNSMFVNIVFVKLEVVEEGLEEDLEDGIMVDGDDRLESSEID